MSWPVVMLGVLLSGTASADAPTFAKKPTAVRSDDRTKIEFTTDRDTDVAVTIEDSNGKVVRHLAAGVLGKNPPEPLKANTRSVSGVGWQRRLRQAGARQELDGARAFGLTPTFDRRCRSSDTSPSSHT